ncbi:MAG: hypothetical protein AB1705_22970 [Verrucomicrobiota bacterium]
MADDEEIKRKAEEEQLAIANETGIAADFAPSRLIYNPATGMVIASVERFAKDAFDRRLFFRHTSERAYRPLESPSPDIHFHDVVTSATHPVIYFAVTRISKMPGTGYGGDWLSVERFDLQQNRTESVFTKENWRLPEPYAKGWISHLLGVTLDNSAIICSCGLQGAAGGKVHYWLATVSVVSREVTLLTRLEQVWF